MTATTDVIRSILKDSNYHLDLFSDDEINALRERSFAKEVYANLLQHQPRQGEILLSKDGSPGIACHMREKPQKIIPSGGILRLKIKNNRPNANYLTLGIELFADKRTNDAGLRRFDCSSLATGSSERNADSYFIKRETTQNPEKLAIKQNEETAMQWLKEQTSEAL